MGLPFFHDLTLSALDSQGNIVATGPDSQLHINMRAIDAYTNASVIMCDYVDYTGASMTGGIYVLESGICAITPSVILIFTAFTSNGLVITAVTPPFEVSGKSEKEKEYIYVLA